MAEALHTLPYEGGLFDQPPGTVLRMEAILAASAQPETARMNEEEAKARLQARVKRDK